MGSGFWRASTLGTPIWLVAIVAGFFAIAPIVRSVGSDLSDISVEFTTLIVESIVSSAVAGTLFVRNSAPVWRGAALGILTAAVESKRST